MKTAVCTAVLFALSVPVISNAQQVSGVSGAGEDLDLYGVIELFKESESIEQFEQKINDPDSDVNNLDLNSDGEVDFLRVMEYAEGDAHAIQIQAALGEETYKDVATIYVETTDGEEIIAEAVGDPDLYGENYVIEPATVVVVTSFVLLGTIFRPNYAVYRSPWGWRARPPWFRVRRPVPRAVHRRKAARYRNRNTARRGQSSRARKAKNVPRTQRRPGPPEYHLF